MQDCLCYLFDLNSILFIFVISTGAWFMLITGLLMILACVTYHVIIANDPELEIHFPDQTLKPTFNWGFWLTLGTGIFVVIGAVVIKVAYWRYPRETAVFFHHSTILDDQVKGHLASNRHLYFSNQLMFVQHTHTQASFPGLPPLFVY